VAAGWMDALHRASDGLRQRLDEACVVQLGGATGTLAPFGHHGREVVERLAERLGLHPPRLPWHAHRDRLARLASDLAITCGTLGKIARDVALLGQDEIGEVQLTSGGGSSTMPHKHNPVHCAVMLAAATRAPGLVATMLAAMPQESERGLGGWHAEWETMAALTAVTAGAARAGNDAMGAIEVHPERMLRNLKITRGAVMAEAVMFGLATRVGRQRAQAAVTRASTRSRDEQRDLADALLEDQEVTLWDVQRRDVEQWMDPSRYADAAEALVNAALQATGASHADR
jgi:3-carboxy-cis,cis-muconate cycloisomerase